MANHAAHNSKVFKVGLRDFAERDIKPNLLAMLKKVAQRLVDYVDGSFVLMPPYYPGGNDNFPVWSGTMHDATGVGVYVDGALNSYLPTKKADSDNDGVNGIEALNNALHVATSQFTKGIWIVLFSAAPHAYKVNTQGSPWGRGIGFFKNFEDYLLNDVIANLKPIAT